MHQGRKERKEEERDVSEQPETAPVDPFEGYIVSVGAEPSCPASAKVLAYWRSLADADGHVPADRVDLLDLSFAADWIFLSDRLEHGDYRVRFAGPELVRAFRREMTGVRVSEVHNPYARARMHALYDRAAKEGDALLARGEMRTNKDMYAMAAESVVMPLADRTGALTRFLHTLRFKSLEGAWL